MFACNQFGSIGVNCINSVHQHSPGRAAMFRVIIVEFEQFNDNVTESVSAAARIVFLDFFYFSRGEMETETKSKVLGFKTI